MLLAACVACGGSATPPPSRPVTTTPSDPDGPHRAAVATQVAPLVEAGIITSAVVGLYDAGRLEVYGFGKGPAGRPPDGGTLYELGAVTQVFTGLALADAVQRREVLLETAVSELLPPGITVPTFEKRSITLQHLVLHTSGLPNLATPKDASSPYAMYDEDRLYQALLSVRLASPPGTRISESDFGVGLLGFALGRKTGEGFERLVQGRVLGPLELRGTKFGAEGRAFAPPTDDDGKPVPAWRWGVLAGAGGLVSNVRDALKLVDAELDAEAGGKRALRPAMRLTQEPQLASTGANEGLGWVIDDDGRYWRSGATGGHRAYVAFEPRTRRGVVVLASGATALADRLGPTMFAVLEDAAKPPAAMPTAAQLATFAGSYDLAGTKLTVVVDGTRLYLEGSGEPRHRMAPIGGDAFWVEALQSEARFERTGDAVTQVVFTVAGRSLAAPRVP